MNSSCDSRVARICGRNMMKSPLASRLPKLVMTIIALAEEEWLSAACQCRVRAAKRAAQSSPLAIGAATAKKRGQE